MNFVIYSILNSHLKSRNPNIMTITTPRKVNGLAKNRILRQGYYLLALPGMTKSTILAMVNSTQYRITD